MDDLAAVAKRMRQYAFAHPLDPVAALRDIATAKPYIQEFTLDGITLRANFSVVRMPVSACNIAQLSFAEWPGKRPLLPDLVDQVRDAFFDPADIITSISARQRNAAAMLIGQVPIANENTEHFICRDPRRPEGE